VSELLAELMVAAAAATATLRNIRLCCSTPTQHSQHRRLFARGRSIEFARE
jgi:hypothetical protein